MAESRVNTVKSACDTGAFVRIVNQPHQTKYGTAIGLRKAFTWSSLSDRCAPSDFRNHRCAHSQARASLPPLAIAEIVRKPMLAHKAVLEQRWYLCHGALVQMKNVRLDSPELVKLHANNFYQQAVVTKIMPMNNSTQIRPRASGRSLASCLAKERESTDAGTLGRFSSQSFCKRK
jgi:hypothetical protein